MSDFRTVLEKKLDETYISKRNALEDHIQSELDYRQTFGYLRALRDVGELIKAAAKEINGGKSHD